MMVILENRLDALVRLHTPLPPAKIGGAHDPLGGRNNLRREIVLRPERRPDRGADPGRLCDDRLRPGLHAQPDGTALRRRRIRHADDDPGARPAVLAGVPRRARPEDVLLKIASAYEAASKRRVPPPAFGPLS